ncbi:MAG: glycosyltransferase family 39 protein, partial [Candidatus Brocadiae bacterium]|nr:glycosyltransferase family 39 protein [Candidatus Brocadiia bacterium]
MAKAKARRADPTTLQWRVVSLIVFAVAFGSVLVTLDDPGLAWDEPFSIGAGQAYAAWLTRLHHLPFDAETIRAHWRLNHEHPPLAKVAMGLTQRLFAGEGLSIVAARLAIALTFGLLVELVFWLGRRLFSGLVGLLAAACLLCMPRVFGHAHLASLDLAMATTWLLSAAAFAVAIDKGRWPWGVASGVCLGLALLTKINAVFLPVALVAWGVGFHRRRALAPLAWTLGIGVVVFFVGWPWLWLSPIGHLRGYLFPTGRVALAVHYFGRLYAHNDVPWHFPLVMTLATIPIGILFLVFLGGARAVRRFRVSPELALLAIHAAVAIGPFLTPWLPRYDGVRLFLAAFPFLALLAGVGGARCWTWVTQRWPGRPWRPLFITAAFFLSQAAATGWVHPCELSYHNALVGGLWGARRIGLEPTYWHDVVNERLFAWLNQHCGVDDAIAFFPVSEAGVLTVPHPPGS